eukprot:GHVT01035003.1.p1 GENE.GHVT01035003.1~~GHVT01035003.1.p1  ORF type:complete len:1651 (-),score=128.20 GHVT01035003.1:948-5900(-)
MQRYGRDEGMTNRGNGDMLKDSRQRRYRTLQHDSTSSQGSELSTEMIGHSHQENDHFDQGKRQFKVLPSYPPTATWTTHSRRRRELCTSRENCRSPLRRRRGNSKECDDMSVPKAGMRSPESWQHPANHQDKKYNRSDRHRNHNRRSKDKRWTMATRAEEESFRQRVIQDGGYNSHKTTGMGNYSEIFNDKSYPQSNLSKRRVPVKQNEHWRWNSKSTEGKTRGTDSISSMSVKEALRHEYHQQAENITWSKPQKCRYSPVDHGPHPYATNELTARDVMKNSVPREQSRCFANNAAVDPYSQFFHLHRPEYPVPGFHGSQSERSRPNVSSQHRVQNNEILRVEYRHETEAPRDDDARKPRHPWTQFRTNKNRWSSSGTMSSYWDTVATSKSLWTTSRSQHCKERFKGLDVPASSAFGSVHGNQGSPTHFVSLPEYKKQESYFQESGDDGDDENDSAGSSSQGQTDICCTADNEGQDSEQIGEPDEATTWAIQPSESYSKYELDEHVDCCIPCSVNSDIQSPNHKEKSVSMQEKVNESLQTAPARNEETVESKWCHTIDFSPVRPNSMERICPRSEGPAMAHFLTLTASYSEEDNLKLKCDELSSDRQVKCLENSKSDTSIPSLSGIQKRTTLRRREVSTKEVSKRMDQVGDLQVLSPTGGNPVVEAADIKLAKRIVCIPPRLKPLFQISAKSNCGRSRRPLGRRVNKCRTSTSSRCGRIAPCSVFHLDSSREISAVELLPENHFQASSQSCVKRPDYIDQVWGYGGRDSDLTADNSSQRHFNSTDSPIRVTGTPSATRRVTSTVGTIGSEGPGRISRQKNERSSTLSQNSDRSFSDCSSVSSSRRYSAADLSDDCFSTDSNTQETNLQIPTNNASSRVPQNVASGSSSIAFSQFRCSERLKRRQTVVPSLELSKALPSPAQDEADLLGQMPLAKWLSSSSVDFLRERRRRMQRSHIVASPPVPAIAGSCIAKPISNQQSSQSSLRDVAGKATMIQESKPNLLPISLDLELYLFRLHPSVPSGAACSFSSCSACGKSFLFHAPSLLPMAAPWLTTARYCEYTGMFFCSACHKGDQRVLLSRAIYLWDFQMRPVCASAAAFLDLHVHDGIMTFAGIQRRLMETVHNAATASTQRDRQQSSKVGNTVTQAAVLDSAFPLTPSSSEEEESFVPASLATFFRPLTSGVASQEEGMRQAASALRFLSQLQVLRCKLLVLRYISAAVCVKAIIQRKTTGATSSTVVGNLVAGAAVLPPGNIPRGCSLSESALPTWVSSSPPTPTKSPLTSSHARVATPTCSYEGYSLAASAAAAVDTSPFPSGRRVDDSTECKLDLSPRVCDAIIKSFIFESRFPLARSVAPSASLLWPFRASTSSFSLLAVSRSDVAANGSDEILSRIPRTGDASCPTVASFITVDSRRLAPHFRERAGIYSLHDLIVISNEMSQLATDRSLRNDVASFSLAEPSATTTPAGLDNQWCAPRVEALQCTDHVSNSSEALACATLAGSSAERAVNDLCRQLLLVSSRCTLGESSTGLSVATELQSFAEMLQDEGSPLPSSPVGQEQRRLHKDSAGQEHQHKLVSRVSSLVSKWQDHFRRCRACCRGWGRECSICHSPQQWLFPFDFDQAVQCDGPCRTVQHRVCSDRSAECPACYRLS